jgi:hypothetical protein
MAMIASTTRISISEKPRRASRMTYPSLSAFILLL